MVKKILIIDISHLFFRAFYAFPKNLKDPVGNDINAVFGVSQMILSIIETQKPDYIFGGKDLSSSTLRSEKLDIYKKNRPTLDESLKNQIPRVYEFFSSMNIPLFSKEGYEADDIIASISYKYRNNSSYEIEILTGDADAFQLISDNIFVLKPSKGNLEKYDKDYLFKKKNLYPSEIVDFKALAGDVSDNLKGVAGIGEKGATDLIRTFGSLEKIYEAVDTNKVTGKKKEKLEKGKKDAFFTRDMATLYSELDLENFYIDKGNFSNLNLEKSCEFFKSIGSNSLQKRAKEILKNNEMNQKSLF
jgi:DNA polymerase-1